METFFEKWETRKRKEKEKKKHKTQNTKMTKT